MQRPRRGIDDLHVAIDEADLAPGGEHLELPADPVGTHLVVARDDRDEVPARPREAAVHTRHEPLVRLADRADAVAVARDDLGGPVGRAVVDDDDIEPVGRPLLREYRVQRAADEVLELVRQDDAGDKRQVAHDATASGAAVRRAASRTASTTSRQRTAASSPTRGGSRRAQAPRKAAVWASSGSSLGTWMRSTMLSWRYPAPAASPRLVERQLSMARAARSTLTCASTALMLIRRTRSSVVRLAPKVAIVPSAKTTVATAYSSCVLAAVAAPAAWTSTGAAGTRLSTTCRSCSMRSWTTSMSRLRSLAGPRRRQSSPIRVRPSSILRSSRTAGLKCSMCPAATMGPRGSRAAARCRWRASSADSATGFSTRTSQPCSSARSACSTWTCDGDATVTTSTASSRSDGEAKARAPKRSATAAARASSGSCTPTSSHPPSVAKARAWCAPIEPT